MQALPKVLPSILSVSLILFLACGGGGGGSSTNSAVPPPTNVPTTELTTQATGWSAAFTISGTDTQGYSWTGSYNLSVVGPTTVNGTSVVEKDVLESLTRVNVGSISALTQEYYLPSSMNLFTVSYPDSGMTGTPTMQGNFPSVFNVGNFGTGGILSLSNGYTSSSNWQILDGGNGDLIYKVTTNISSGVNETSSIMMNAAGRMVSGQLVMSNWPSSGVTTTLNLTRQ